MQVACCSVEITGQDGRKHVVTTDAAASTMRSERLPKRGADSGVRVRMWLRSFGRDYVGWKAHGTSRPGQTTGLATTVGIRVMRTAVIAARANPLRGSRPKMF